MTTKRDRNIPPGTSLLSGTQPTLTASVDPLKVGARGDQQQTEEQDQEQIEQHPAPAPRKGRSRGGRRLPPAVEDAVALTVRVDPDEAREINLLLLELMEATRRNRIDKAEVLRELLIMAREHEPTRKALVKRLKS